MNILEFVSNINLSGGLARQNRYDVWIYTKSLVEISNVIARKNKENLLVPEEAVNWITDYMGFDMDVEQKALAAYCERSELPSYQFATESHRIYGPQFKIPHLPEYQDVTMTFVCGADMAEKYFFDAWMYLVMDPITNNFNYLNEYSTNIDIIQYDETSEKENRNWYMAQKRKGTQLNTNMTWFNAKKAPARSYNTNMSWFNSDRSPGRDFNTNIIWFNTIRFKPPFLRLNGGPTNSPNDRARLNSQSLQVQRDTKRREGPKTDTVRDSARYSDTTLPKSNYVVTLIDAYPIAVNTMDLSYDATNTLQKVQVTFTYKYAIPFDGKDSPKNVSARGKRELFGATIGDKAPTA